MKYQTFLINLDKSTDRLASSSKHLDDLSMSFERVPAIYGANIAPNIVEQYYSPNAAGSYHKELNLGEIGCYLSHRKAWKLIVERNLDFAYIFEDDFLPLISSFDEITELVKSIRTPWHLIKLRGNHKKSSEITSYPIGNYHLSLLKKVPTRTGAQIVSYEGAKRLLASSKSFGRPIDVDLQYWWQHHIWVHALTPYPCTSEKGGDSEIEKFSARKSATKRRLRKISNKISFELSIHRQAKKLIIQEPLLLEPPVEDNQ